MAKTFTAPFAQTPKSSSTVATAVCSNFTVSSAVSNAVHLATAGADGGILTRLSAIPRATITSASLLVFSSKDAGVNLFLEDSALMAAHTVASDTAIPVTTFARYTEDTPKRMEAGERIYVGTQVALAEGIVFNTEWTDF